MSESLDESQSLDVTTTEPDVRAFYVVAPRKFIILFMATLGHRWGCPVFLRRSGEFEIAATFRRHAEARRERLTKILSSPERPCGRGLQAIYSALMFLARTKAIPYKHRLA